MRLEDKIFINATSISVFEIIRNFEEYVNFMMGVESIEFISANEDVSITDWKISVNGTLLAWRQQSRFDVVAQRIEFQAIAGDFKGYEGSWELSKRGGGTEVRLAIDIDWEVSTTLRYVQSFAERKARAVARNTLRALRRRALYGAGHFKRDSIVTEPFSFSNRKKMRMVGCYDHLSNQAFSQPILVVLPGYGETKRDALSTAYYLAKNGFHEKLHRWA